MTDQEITIIFRDEKAFLTPDHALEPGQLGLPEFVHGFTAAAFWIARVLNCKNGNLFCEVLSYRNGETGFPQTQLALAEDLEQIHNVHFRSIDTAGLLRTLNTAKPRPMSLPSEIELDEPEPAYLAPMPAMKTPQVKFIQEKFFIPLKQVRFRLGGVSFDRHIAGLGTMVEMHIENYEIREEFDAVKNYFANVLRTKKIQVIATIETEDNHIKNVKALSPEIAKIDKQLIDNVRFEFVKSTKRKVVVEVEKNLLTMEEYLDNFGQENFGGKAFYKDENELFEDLLHIANSKHYKHLRFLSSQHCHNVMKLRFVHKPFSFIFLLQGERHYHLVWETLDTEEATYVWHSDKNLDALKRTVRKIEDIINVVKVQGKTAYINSTEDRFRRIYHDYSAMVDGFMKWKLELESVIT